MTKPQTNDLLRGEYINSLPQPFLIRLGGDKIRWPLEYIDIETGCLKFDVCGKLQRGHIGDVIEFIDSDGKSHEPDSFYSDYSLEDQFEQQRKKQRNETYWIWNHGINGRTIRSRVERRSLECAWDKRKKWTAWTYRNISGGDHMPETVTTKPPYTFEYEKNTYYCSCPECGEYHEADESQIGKTIECICGIAFEVRRE
jgi:hypothetical protein